MSDECGKRFSHLVRSASGNEPTARCTLYCNESNVEDWQEGSRLLKRRVMQMVGSLDVSGPLKTRIATWSSEVDGQSDPTWYPGEWGLQVGRAIGLLGDGACIVDLIDSEAKTQGSSVVVPSAAVGSGGGIVGFLTGSQPVVLWIGGGLALWYFLRK